MPQVSTYDPSVKVDRLVVPDGATYTVMRGHQTVGTLCLYESGLSIDALLAIAHDALSRRRESAGVCEELDVALSHVEAARFFLRRSS